MCEGIHLSEPCECDEDVIDEFVADDADVDDDGGEVDDEGDVDEE